MTILDGRKLLNAARDRVRQFRTTSVLTICFNELRAPPDDGIGWYERKPYLPLLFMKWSLASWRPNDERPEPTDEDVGFIFQTAFDAVGKLHRLDGNPEVFLRRLTLQQVWFQRRFDASSLARQSRILCELMETAPSMRGFETHTGLTPLAFIKQLAYLAADAGDEFGIEALSCQRPMGSRNNAHWTAARAFFAKRIPDLHRAMRDLEALDTQPEVEVCEQSPLIKTPFFDTTDGPVCLHHKLLFRMLECALFDIARAMDPRAFMNDFGPAFEAYLAEILVDTEARVLREAELEAKLLGQGKVVDFAVISDDALVLLDAKGIEGHYDELYHNLPSQLAERLKSSILKSVDQAADTVRRLPDDLRRPKIYFLCVTFKQLAIGDGAALRQLTAGTPDWSSDRWAADKLPPGHMFFASISEVERLVAESSHHQVPLARLIESFAQSNAAPETRRALFEMHLGQSAEEMLAPRCIQGASVRLRS